MTERELLKWSVDGWSTNDWATIQFLTQQLSDISDELTNDLLIGARFTPKDLSVLAGLITNAGTRLDEICAGYT
jgi:hypothetical protein